MWLVLEPISRFSYEQRNPADVSTIPGMHARIPERKLVAMTWIGERYISCLCSSRTLELALFVSWKYLVILQALWGRNLFNGILDGTNHICHTATKGWSGRKELLFCFSFQRWQVGRILCRAIILDAAGILFKYCKKTSLKSSLLY